MIKFEKIHQDDSVHDRTKVTHEIDDDFLTLDTLIEEFTSFVKGIGYHLKDSRIDVVPEDIDVEDFQDYGSFFAMYCIDTEMRIKEFGSREERDSFMAHFEETNSNFLMGTIDGEMTNYDDTFTLEKK